MKKKLFHNLSANMLQLVVNQVFSVLVFYILSVNIDKNSFGQINLALAVLLSAFNILSFGIDQVVVKKVAHGDDAANVLSLYLFHVVFTGVFFYGLLLLGWRLFSHNSELYRVIICIGAGRLMLFFSTPLKQISSGLERFKLLSYMLIVSNMVRALGLVILALMHLITVQTITLMFVTGDTLELLFSIYLFRKYIKVPVFFSWNKIAYLDLLKQSLPQVGVVLITSALARFDWLFIGFILSAAKLAEYSFAYKLYEISTLPLLAIAPLLTPRFTRLFKTGDHREADLKLIIKAEMIVAAFTVLLLNICWNPFIDMLTKGRYGAVNTTTIFILSLCIPFMYLSNFLWTIFFVQNRLKMIFQSFLLTFIVNVVADLILIPIYKNEGAAVAFLLACIVQIAFYIYQTTFVQLKNSIYNLIICLLCAVASFWSAKIFFQNVWLAIIAAIAFYLFSLFITMQLKRGDGKQLLKILLG